MSAGHGPVLVPVLPNHRFDESALDQWLRARLPEFGGLVSLRQFQGGQSNPTFLVEGASSRYVLRKKPPGTLLPSAHAVDREFRVLRALAGSDVPVPEVLVLCEDPAIIGTAFYLMRYVDGRVFTQPGLQDVPAAERAPLYLGVARTLAALHRVDWRAVGLEGFGRPESYIARQVKRWSQQYAVTGVESKAMDELTAWVSARIPPDDATGSGCTIAHGDFRLGNLLYAPDGTEVRAVLDWELATIGHPLADLAYSALAWHQPVEAGGLAGLDDPALPTEAQYLEAYRQASGRASIDDYPFFVAFSLFRLAAIQAGVYRRALDGIGADARGVDAGRRFATSAEVGWDVARRS